MKALEGVFVTLAYLGGALALPTLTKVSRSEGLLIVVIMLLINIWLTLARTNK